MTKTQTTKWFYCLPCEGIVPSETVDNSPFGTVEQCAYCGTVPFYTP